MLRTCALGQCALLILLAGTVAVEAQSNQAWTTVGSAGTVDEADLALARLGTPVPAAVSMPPVLGTVHIRYNVVAVGGVLGPSIVALRARYLDRGPGQRVVLRLKEYGLRTGVTSTLVTLDSDQFDSQPTFQFRATTPPGCNSPLVMLDFTSNAYFVDVELSRFVPRPGPAPTHPPLPFLLLEPDADGPALGGIQIGPPECVQ